MKRFLLIGIFLLQVFIQLTPIQTVQAATPETITWYFGQTYEGYDYYVNINIPSEFSKPLNGSEQIIFYFPVIENMDFRLVVSDSDYNPSVDIFLEDVENLGEGFYFVNLLDFTNNNERDIYYFEVFFPSDTEESLINEFLYNSTIDLYPYEVHFMAELVLIESAWFSEVPDYISTSCQFPTTFDGWRLYNNTIYDFETPIEESQLVDNVLYLYRYCDDGVPDNPEPTIPTGINGLLNILKLNNESGYLIFYLVLFFLMNGLLLYFTKVPKIVYLIINAALTGIFMVMGLLPIYMSLTLITLYIAFFFMKEDMAT